MRNGKHVSPDGETATVSELAASYGITVKSMWRFLWSHQIPPAGYIATSRRPARVYRIVDVARIRDERPSMRTYRERHEQPSTVTMSRLALAMRGW